jgi:hypothetical protein
MRKNQLIPLALSSLLLASPLAIAEATQHPETTAEDAASVATADAPPTEAPGNADDISDSSTSKRGIPP